MSIVKCEDCNRNIDLDIEDDYAFSHDDGETKYLCWRCSEKEYDFDEFEYADDLNDERRCEEYGE